MTTERKAYRFRLDASLPTFRRDGARLLHGDAVVAGCRPEWSRNDVIDVTWANVPLPRGFGVFPQVGNHVAAIEAWVEAHPEVLTTLDRSPLPTHRQVQPLTHKEKPAVDNWRRYLKPWLPPLTRNPHYKPGCLAGPVGRLP